MTSTVRAGDGINAGYELTELARAYYVFRANGYGVKVASPKGGRAPVNIDDELTDYGYAFLNDPEAQQHVTATLAVAEVDPAEALRVTTAEAARYAGEERHAGIIAAALSSVQRRGYEEFSHGPSQLAPFARHRL